MAYQLQLWIQCASAKQAKQLHLLLARESRPYFADDLPEAQQPLFELIEDIEFPHEIEHQKQHLWLWWHDTSLILSDLSPLIAATGIQVQAAFEIPDYAMSGDIDGDEEGWFLVPEMDGFKRASREQVEQLVSQDVMEKIRGQVSY